MADQSHHAFRGLFDVFAEMGRMREHLTSGDAPADGSGGDARAWIPTLDIYADGQDLVIRCELAGIPKSDVDVSLCNGQLWISGERTGAPETASYYVRERRYGAFRRIVTLPEGIDGDAISATVEDGLLEVVIAGGAATDRHERIEIAGAESAETRLDVNRS